MNVADIWQYTQIHGLRGANELPPFKWYDLGLVYLRNAFAESIGEYAESEDDMLPYEVRDILKSMRFVDLWDRLYLYDLR